jgi:hypothetical protein
MWNEVVTMTYAFTQDVPIDAATYERIIEGIGPELPPGLLVHLAIVKPEGGLRYVDVWESEAEFEKFADSRLHPVIRPMLAEVFGEDNVPPEPRRDPLDVIHAWRP